MCVHTPSIFPSPSYKALFKLSTPGLSSFLLRFLPKGCSGLPPAFLRKSLCPAPNLPLWSRAVPGHGASPHPRYQVPSSGTSRDQGWQGRCHIPPGEMLPPAASCPGRNRTLHPAFLFI